MGGGGGGGVEASPPPSQKTKREKRKKRAEEKRERERERESEREGGRGVNMFGCTDAREIATPPSTPNKIIVARVPAMENHRTDGC